MDEEIMDKKRLEIGFAAALYSLIICSVVLGILQEIFH